MVKYSDSVVESEAGMIIQGNLSLRDISKSLNIPLTTVWWHMNKRLPKINPWKYRKVKDILVTHIN